MSPVRVLLVDDDPIMLKVLSRLLLRYGYEVFPASGADQALEIIKNAAPVDIVVTDISMPEMLGTELIREIGALSPGTVGALMTGAVAQQNLPDGVPVLSKPFSVEELTHFIETSLAQSVRLRAEP
jgi:CheY-like chemotaxis protein